VEERVPDAGRSVRVMCFEISQNPAEKTDYRHVIPVGGEGASNSPRQEVAAAVWQVHRALAEALPRREGLIGFPILESASGRSWLCLCRCTAVPNPEGRAFLHTRAIAAPAVDLRAEGMDPLALYFSNVWLQMDIEHSPDLIVSCAPVLWKEGTDVPLVGEATARLADEGGEPVVWRDLGYPRALRAVHLAIQCLEPEQQARASFAIGVPAAGALPTRPSLVALDPASERSRPTSESERSQLVPDRPGRSRPIAEESELTPAAGQYVRFLRRMAAWLADSDELTPLWRGRLWNQCQDLITLAEEWLTAHPRFQADARRHVQQKSALLVRELRRAEASRELLGELRTWMGNLRGTRRSRFVREWVALRQQPRRLAGYALAALLSVALAFFLRPFVVDWIATKILNKGHQASGSGSGNRTDGPRTPPRHSKAPPGEGRSGASGSHSSDAGKRSRPPKPN
jgi:hypothetical protein